jgi:hypothetical protein
MNAEGGKSDGGLLSDPLASGATPPTSEPSPLSHAAPEEQRGSNPDQLTPSNTQPVAGLEDKTESTQGSDLTPGSGKESTSPHKSTNDIAPPSLPDPTDTIKSTRSADDSTSEVGSHGSQEEVESKLQPDVELDWTEPHTTLQINGVTYASISRLRHGMVDLGMGTKIAAFRPNSRGKKRVASDFTVAFIGHSDKTLGRYQNKAQHLRLLVFSEAEQSKSPLIIMITCFLPVSDCSVCGI